MRRRAALGALVALSLLLVLAGCRAGRSTRRAEAPVTPSADTSTSAAAGPLRYAVLGDSYSNGQSVAAGCAWPDVMADRLTREGLATRVVANPSVTGATTAEMLDIGLGPIRASRPDVMTVMLGVNDEFQGHSLARFAADYADALGDAVAITGAPRRVIAVSIPDYSVTPAGQSLGDPGAIARRIDAFNGVLATVAARHGVRVVSVTGISRQDGAAQVASDGLHPACSQLAQWAARIAAVARVAWGGLTPRRR